MKFDVETLAGPISEEAPSGEDLSYDVAYLELEKLAKGTVETQFSEGEEPDWKAVQRSSVELLGRTKSLRVLIYLAVSSLQQDGFPGFRDAIRLFRRTLEDAWDTVHPQLDPDDNLDPLERMNILASLSPPPGAYGDELNFEDKIMHTPLCLSQQIGKFNLRDMLIAQDVIKVEGAGEDDIKPPDMALINAAFQDTEMDTLVGIHESLKELIEDIQAIDAFTTEKVGAGAAVNLNGIVKVLQQAMGATGGQLELRGYGAGEDAAESSEEGAAEEGGGGGGGESGGQRISGDINSNQDVLLAINKIEKYYQKVEPSSPVPLIIGRAKNLVGKSFIQILDDLSPAAIAQVETVSGKSASELAQEGEAPAEGA